MQTFTNGKIGRGGMAKHKSMHELKAFKSWKEARDAFNILLSLLSDAEKEMARPGILIGTEMAQFRFRLELTVENERRKKR